MMGFGLGVYAKNSKEAVALYCEAFGLELGYHVLTEEGNYFHSVLLKDGDPYIAVAEVYPANLPNGMSMEFDNPVELGYTVESEAEFYRIFHLLKEKGKIIMDVCTLQWSPLAAIVMDRFGVRWYLTMPQVTPDEATMRLEY